MITRYGFVGFLMIVAFLFSGNSAFACETNSDKSCCKTETKKEVSKKSCCDNSNPNKETKNCGGKCGHSNCTSISSVNFSVMPTFDFYFKNATIDFCSKKSVFYTSKTFISSGFISVWLPPKIK